MEIHVERGESGATVTVARVVVERVHPLLGLRSGGTLVTVYGAGLVDAASARCRFADAAVPARLLAPPSCFKLDSHIGYVRYVPGSEDLFYVPQRARVCRTGCRQGGHVHVWVM